MIVSKLSKIFQMETWPRYAAAKTQSYRCKERHCTVYKTERNIKFAQKCNQYSFLYTFSVVVSMNQPLNVSCVQISLFNAFMNCVTVLVVSINTCNNLEKHLFSIASSVHNPW